MSQLAIADELAAQGNKSCSTQLSHVIQIDRRISGADLLSVHKRRSGIGLTSLPVDPHLDRSTLGVLIGDGRISRLADTVDVDVNLSGPSTSVGASHLVQQVNRIVWQSVDDLIGVQRYLPLFNRPQIDTTVGPLNRQQVQAAASRTKVIARTQLLAATLKRLFNQVIDVEVKN